MNWNIEWLFPVIIFFIWIVNAFVRSTQEERQNKRAQRPAGETAKGFRRSQTEIDRFLEEVNKRRREAAERKEPERSPPLAQPAVALGRPPVATPRPPGRLAQAKPTPRKPAVRALPTSGQAVDVVIAEVVAAEPPRERLAAPENQGAPVVDIQPSEGRPTPQTTVRALERGLSLLHSPESLQAAWLVREILGPPRCRRHGL